MHCAVPCVSYCRQKGTQHTENSMPGLEGTRQWRWPCLRSSLWITELCWSNVKILLAAASALSRSRKYLRCVLSSSSSSFRLRAKALWCCTEIISFAFTWDSGMMTATRPRQKLPNPSNIYSTFFPQWSFEFQILFIKKLIIEIIFSLLLLYKSNSNHVFSTSEFAKNRCMHVWLYVYTSGKIVT